MSSVWPLLVPLEGVPPHLRCVGTTLEFFLKRKGVKSQTWRCHLSCREERFGARLGSLLLSGLDLSSLVSGELEEHLSCEKKPLRKSRRIRRSIMRCQGTSGTARVRSRPRAPSSWPAPRVPVRMRCAGPWGRPAAEGGACGGPVPHVISGTERHQHPGRETGDAHPRGTEKADWRMCREVPVS